MKFFKIVTLGVAFSAILGASEVNIYSHRHYDTDKGIFKAFTDKTGIKVNVLQAKANELAQRLESEGKNSKADIFMTADAGNLEQVRVAGLFQSVTSKTIENLSPKAWRGKNNEWFAISKRARIIIASKERVPKGSIANYEDLTDKKWSEKVLVRSSSAVYNISLLSQMIETLGRDEAKAWASGIVQNMARTPKGADRDQIRAVYAKEGDVAISNSYYLGHLLNSKNTNDKKAGESVYVIFPNQDGRGTHINVSGIGVLKNAPNKANAIKLVEFLLSPEAQKMLTDGNFEYPINPSVEPNALLKSWGEFKVQEPDFESYYKNAKEALKIFDEVEWK
ncbi:Fe(3+) ABC transporter substrate-binding protein [Helicobacter sp. 23-1045]